MVNSSVFESAGNYFSSLAGWNSLGEPSREFASLCFRKVFKLPGGMIQDVGDFDLVPTLPKISNIIPEKLYGFCLKPCAYKATQLFWM